MCIGINIVWLAGLQEHSQIDQRTANFGFFPFSKKILNDSNEIFSPSTPYYIPICAMTLSY